MNLSPSTSTPTRFFTLPRLNPIEFITLLALLYSVFLVDMYGRGFYFLFAGNLGSVVVQLNWLLPCFFARYLFSLFGVSRKTPHIFYLVYYVLLTVLFFGSQLELALSASEAGSQGPAAAEVLNEEGGETSEVQEPESQSTEEVKKTPSPGEMAMIIIGSIVKINIGFFLIVLVITALRFNRDRDGTKKVVVSELREDLYVCRLLISLMLCGAIYSNLKAMVPLVREDTLYDLALYKIDCLLFLGNDPFVWLNSFNSDFFVTLMSRSYFFFFFFIIFGFTGSWLLGSTRQFEKTMAAFIIAYLIGSIGYFAIPAVGPAFHANIYDVFQATENNPLKSHLSALYNNMVSYPKVAPIVRFNGLAAFPSLHVAHSVLFMFYLWFSSRAGKILVAILVIPFILLVISTIYLGWHYVIDLPAGVGVAALTIYFVRKLYPENKGGDAS